MPVRWPPERLAPWPPSPTGTRRDVTLKDNWGDLAKIAGIPALDLIEYNFQTRIPEVINWYLHNFVGCTTTTGDGKNYRFGPGTRTVYLPPAGWTRNASDDDHEVARKQVLNTLLGATAQKVHFTLDWETVYAGDMAAVAGYILQGKIRVRYDASHPGRARYRPADSNPADGIYDGDCLFLGDLANTSAHRALIVHEAVHAMQDIRSKSYTVVRAEAMAHVAQCLYLLQSGHTSPPVGTVLGKAWLAAANIFFTGSATYQDAYDLYMALGSDPVYAGKPDPNFNGI